MSSTTEPRTVASLGDIPLHGEEGRAAYPYAVSINGETFRFATSELADFMANIGTDETETVRRFVALTEPEWSASTPIQGWREVSHFA